MLFKSILFTFFRFVKKIHQKFTFTREFIASLLTQKDRLAQTTALYELPQ